MPRRLWNDGQEITHEDLSAIAPALERELYDVLVKELVQGQTNGFFGDSFKPERVDATTIRVAPGLGFQYDSAQVSPEPTWRMLYSAAYYSRPVTAAHATLPRIDLIAISHNLYNEVTGTRNYKAPSSSSISAQSMTLQKDWNFNVQVVAGTPAASPVAPAAPAGYFAIGQVYVTPAVGVAAAGDVTDSRTLLMAGAYARKIWQDQVDQASDPSAPSAGRLRVYSKSGGLFIRKPDGSVGQLQSNLETTFTIANDQPTANVTGISFSSATYRSAVISYDVRRKTDTASSEVRGVGKIVLAYRTQTSAWEIVGQEYYGDDIGINWSVTSDGQLQYTTSLIAGANYIGTASFKSETFNA